MSKRQEPGRSMSKGPIRVTRREASASAAVVSVAWTYDNERGRTVWLRPASGIEIAGRPHPSLR
ncbi:hypothetical protein [Microbacterium rhizosphaerae]|uniref:Uncharacterized protein n=1 Tax=Microbacterium rhizosphaerae TaxID=1678237 RepID=A0ABZ0SMK7_9MICO|nr:hypothetical protein [Microbacterium rhizosphaerae]WPR89419.1 hypothetical protein SM116_16930 [Microbacterium rhizosphaerae]